MSEVWEIWDCRYTNLSIYKFSLNPCKYVPAFRKFSPEYYVFYVFLKQRCASANRQVSQLLFLFCVKYSAFHFNQMGVSVYVDRASTTYYQVLTWKWHAVVLLYLQKFGQMLSSCLYALFKSTVHSSGHCLILVASVSLGYSSVSTVTSFWLDHQGSISRTGQGYFLRLLAQTNFRIHTALSPIYCTLVTLHTEARLSTHHYLVPKLRIYGAEPLFSIGPRGVVFKLGT